MGYFMGAEWLTDKEYLEAIYATVDSVNQRLAEGLAAMPEDVRQLPHAEARAFFYTSPDERAHLEAIGGPAVRQILEEFDDIYSGKNKTIFEEDIAPDYAGGIVS